jgi:hypothetical protein
MNRKPTAKQRQALWFIATDRCSHADVPEVVDVQGGYDNQAVFLMRLLDRGWVEFRLTDDGYEALGYVPCRGCGEWCHPEDDEHLAHLEPDQ